MKSSGSRMVACGRSWSRMVAGDAARVWWNSASVRARRQPARGGSRVRDRLLRGRRAKKLRVSGGHGGHGGLIPPHLGGGRRAVLVPVFSPRFGMPLFLGVVRFLVLPFPQILLLDPFLAVPVEGRRALELAAVAARGTLRLPRPSPAVGERQRVAGQVAQRPAHRDLRPARPPSIVERQERLLSTSYPRIRVVVILFYMLLEHAVVREILLKQINLELS